MIYDVTIIGGGLAGLTLAYQLHREISNLSICLIHDQKFPNEDVAFKVGEATIELGGFYLRDTLGLGEYMKQEHFIKMGMRFIETNGNTYREMGIGGFPMNDSYQFERGKLENYIFSLIENKVNVCQNTRFLDAETNGLIKKLNLVDFDNGPKTLNTRWLIDASGRKKTFSKEKHLSVKQSLPNSSVWFRVDGAVLIDDIYIANENNPFRHIDRSYSSLHIEGKGYWIWVLRLSKQTTSVGIAFSEDIYDMNELSTLDKTFEWLKKYEITFYNYLKTKDFPILDFKYLRKYATASSSFLSEKRWALTGDANTFMDPVYSGGLDNICISNTCITDVIAKEKQGVNISEYIDFYNKINEDILDVYVSCFYKMYEKKDNWYYIYAKYIVDSAMYFGAIAPFFMNEATKDFENAKKIWKIVCNIFDIYKKTVTIIKDEDFHKYNMEIPNLIDLTPSLFSQINSNVKLPLHLYKERLSNPANGLTLLLEDNLAVMNKLYEYVSTRKNIADFYFKKENANLNEQWRYGAFFKKTNNIL